MMKQRHGKIINMTSVSGVAGNADRLIIQLWRKQEVVEMQNQWQRGGHQKILM